MAFPGAVGPRCISCAVQERSSANLPLPVLELLGMEQVDLRGKPRVESRGDVPVAHIWELMLFSPHAAHLSREFFRGGGSRCNLGLVFFYPLSTAWPCCPGRSIELQQPHWWLAV